MKRFCLMLFCLLLLCAVCLPCFADVLPITEWPGEIVEETEAETPAVSDAEAQTLPAETMPQPEAKPLTTPVILALAGGLILVSGGVLAFALRKKHN